MFFLLILFMVPLRSVPIQSKYQNTKAVDNRALTKHVPVVPRVSPQCASAPCFPSTTPVILTSQKSRVRRWFRS
jgi:hypothetical protein